MYANIKLQTVVCDRVASELENLSYSCGSLFADINVDETNDVVNVRGNINCKSPIEVPYYSGGHELTCYHCGTTEDIGSKENHFPVCSVCIRKDLQWVARRTHNFKAKD